MFDRFDQNPILHALRTHVALDTEVSAALAALHHREGAGLAELLNEARDLASRLNPSKHGAESRLDLETWLGTMLRGPHNGAWFDTRIQYGRRGWANMPPLASAVLIANLRHRLTEMAMGWEDPPGATGNRIAHALGRLFDLEMAIIIVDVEAGATAATHRDHPDSGGASAREATLAIGNALAVIETSAYLVGRYCNLDRPPLSDIERHLDRIAKHVLRTKAEVARLLKAVAGVPPLVH